MANIAPGVLLQLLLKLLRQHLYLWLLLPSRLNYTLLQGLVAKDKTANIYTDSRYAFEVAYDFGIL